MAERFLRYSLERGRKVRALILEEDGETVKYYSILVVSLSESEVAFLSGARKTPRVVALDRVLSASYARGDDGDLNA